MLNTIMTDDLLSSFWRCISNLWPCTLTANKSWGISDNLTLFLHFIVNFIYRFARTNHALSYNLTVNRERLQRALREQNRNSQTVDCCFSNRSRAAYWRVFGDAWTGPVSSRLADVTWLQSDPCQLSSQLALELATATLSRVTGVVWQTNVNCVDWLIASSTECPSSVVHNAQGLLSRAVAGNEVTKLDRVWVHRMLQLTDEYESISSSKQTIQEIGELSEKRASHGRRARPTYDSNHTGWCTREQNSDQGC